MGRLARNVAVVFVVSGAALACTAITGADSLTADLSDAPTNLPARPDDDAPSGTESSGSSSGGQGPADAGTDSLGVSDGAPTNDAPADVTPDPKLFLDTFTRADNAALGNGWIEKTDVFAIVNGASEKGATTTTYKDMLAYRPPAEDVADAEVSVDVAAPGGTAVPTGLLAVRIQAASSASSTLVAYFLYTTSASVTLYRDGPTLSLLARQTVTVPAARTMKLSVSGTNPVKLVAIVTDGSGAEIANIAHDDATADRITAAGSVGFGSTSACRHDNFRRTNL